MISLFAFALLTPAAQAATSEPWPITLRTQIQRLATVGYRLDLAAAHLCTEQAAGTGLALDYIQAYPAGDRPAVAQLLGLGDVPQIAAVVPDGPAEKAGIRVGDDLLSIDGEQVTGIISASSDPALLSDELEQRMASRPASSPILLGLRRGGEPLEVKLVPTATCPARFVLKTGEGITAVSDGVNVAVSSKLITFSRNDDEVALIAGHELGHVLHRDGTARSLGERRSMEDRADLLGARLAACAGYDPELGLQFWLRRDSQDWLRLFRDPTHRSRKARVELMRKDLANITCPVEPLSTHG